MAHKWMIPEREYRRQETRRGRRYAYERLDPLSTALVVVDMVPFFTDSLAHCRDVIEPINAVAGALRAAGGTVAWVIPESRSRPTAHAVEFYGAEIAFLFGRSGGEGPLPGRLCEDLETQASDLFVEKTSASAFFPGCCHLHDQLAARGIHTVIVTGTVTNVCCESTARDASTLGYRVIFAADAAAAPNDAAHNATLCTIYRSFGDVRPTTEILELIAAGGAAHRPA